MNKLLKINLLIIILILALFANSCNTSNTSDKILSEEEYFTQQALKNNQSDTLFLGLSLTMNKEQVLAQLKKEGAWDFYSTMNGDYRLQLYKEGKIEGMEDWFPSDNYIDNNAFVTKVVLKSEDGRYSENHAHILLDFYEDRLLNLILSFEGRHYDTRSKCDNQMFTTLKTMLMETYGEPYKVTGNSALWVDGNIHIALTSEGIRRQVADKYDISETGYTYRPFYLITYTDWLFSNTVKEKKIKEQQEKQRQKYEADSLNQERLSKEYKGL